MTDTADEFLTGWAYWQYKTLEDFTTTAKTGSEGFFNPDGSIQSWKVKALARSYVTNTQGTLSSMNFNVETAEFEAEFVLNASLSSSVLYLSS